MKLQISYILQTSESCVAEAKNLHALFETHAEEPGIGEYLFNNSQVLFDYLEKAGVIVPLSELVMPFSLAGQFYILYGELTIPHLPVITAALSLIFNSARSGNFTYITKSQEEEVSAEEKEGKTTILLRLIRHLHEIAELEDYMNSIGALSCPVCGRPLRKEEIEPVRKTILCYVCNSVVPVDSAQKTAAEGLKPPANLYESFNDIKNPDSRNSYQYDIFISYRHLEEDFRIANELAELCTSLGLRTFFAPNSLWMDNQLTETGNWPVRWVRELKHALLTSAHFVVIISPAFSESTHCELELRGIHEINKLNPLRHYWIKPLNFSKEQLPMEMREKMREFDCKSLSSEIFEKIAETNIVPGSGPIRPLECFSPLPLVTDAWGANIMFDPDPPEEEFQDIVRELLLLSMRGVELSNIEFKFPWRWQQSHIDAAKQEVEQLLEHNILPFPPLPDDDLKIIFGKNSNTTTSKINHLDLGTKIHDEPGSKVYDTDKNNWYVLNDYRGQGYPADMDFECRKCKYREGVGDPRNPPLACPNCGFNGAQK